MKVKVTKQMVMKNYKLVIGVGYCDLQHLLNYESPKYYLAWRSWKADVYELGDTAIVTGYEYFGIHDYEISKKFERKAVDKRDRDKLTELIEEYISCFKRKVGE